MKCPACGKDLPEGITTCTDCGTPISVPASVTIDEIMSNEQYRTIKELIALFVGIVCLMLIFYLGY